MTMKTPEKMIKKEVSKKKDILKKKRVNLSFWYMINVYIFAAAFSLVIMLSQNGIPNIEILPYLLITIFSGIVLVQEINSIKKTIVARTDFVITHVWLVLGAIGVLAYSYFNPGTFYDIQIITLLGVVAVLCTISYTMLKKVIKK